MVEFEKASSGGTRELRQPLPGEPVITVDFGETRAAQAALSACTYVTSYPPEDIEPPIGMLSSRWMRRDMRMLERSISFSLSNPRLKIPGGVACGLLISLVAVGSSKNILDAQDKSNGIKITKDVTDKMGRIATELQDNIDVYEPLIHNLRDQVR